MKTIRTGSRRPYDRNQGSRRATVASYRASRNSVDNHQQMQPARLSALRQTVRTLAFHEAPDLALGLCFPSLTDSRRLVAVLPLAVVPLEATKLFVATRTRRNHRDSPPEHLDQSSAPFGSYTFACGQSAACGNGQPDPAVWTNDDLEKLHDVPG